MIQQVDSNGNLSHLLTIDGLKADTVKSLIHRARNYFDDDGSLPALPDLTGKTVANLFFEPSTRTRSTFELAAKRLGATVLNLNIQHSSAKKGESLRDTIRNLEAMQCDLMVVRHGTSGAAHFVASEVKPGVGVINAGDGRHSHPTQALLDTFTILKHFPDLSAVRVAIVGDVLHSRVARSQIQALHVLGAQEVRLIGPKTLLPANAGPALGVHVYQDLATGLKDVDVVIVLRLQLERMQGTLLPAGNAFYQQYGITQASLASANPNAIVIHPGPMNRGVEIQSEIADGPHAVILDQVTNGIAIRMAVLSWIAETQGANR